jgi:hypothetical protein
LDVFTTWFAAAVVSGRRLVEEEAFAALPLNTIRDAYEGSVIAQAAVIVGVAVAKTVVTHQTGLSLSGH